MNIFFLIFFLLFSGISFAQNESDQSVIPDNTRFGARFIPERRPDNRTTSQNGTGAIWFNTATGTWWGDTGTAVIPFGGGAPSFVIQNPNTVFSGPASGGPATPGFRALVAADIPSLDASKITSGTFISNLIPDLDAAKITSGIFNVARIPGLDVAKIVSGTFATSFIPNLDAAKITTGIFAGARIPALNTLATGLTALRCVETDGSGLLISSSTACGTAGGGSVSSVAVGNLSPLFTSSVANPTSTPSISFALVSQNQNLFYGSPDGSSGNPAFRALVAADIPSLDAAKITSGVFSTARIPDLDAAKIVSGVFSTARIPSLDASKITTGIFDIARIPLLPASQITSGLLAVARGGTNIGSYNIGDMLYASSSTGLNQLGIGTNGQVMTVVGGIPAWTTLPTGTGTVTNVSSGSLSPLFTTNITNPTTTPAISYTLSTQPQNLIFASPNGSSGVPTFRSLVDVDIPNISASKITSGTLVVSVGGTGFSSYTAGDILFASAPTVIDKLPIGSTNAFLRVVGGLPSWYNLLASDIISLFGECTGFLRSTGTCSDSHGDLSDRDNISAGHPNLYPLATSGSAPPSAGAVQSDLAHIYLDTNSNTPIPDVYIGAGIGNDFYNVGFQANAFSEITSPDGTSRNANRNQTALNLCSDGVICSEYAKTANFTNQPNNDGIEIVSSNAGDTTQTITLVGTTTGTGSAVFETITLNGTTAVATSKVNWGNLHLVIKSATTTGTITIREASGDATITIIAPGDLYAANTSLTWIRPEIKLKEFNFNYVLKTGSALVNGDDRARIFSYEGAGTLFITKIKSWSDVGTSTFNVQKNDGSAADICSSDITNSTSGVECTTFTAGENTLIAGQSWGLDLVTAAASGVPTEVHLAITGYIK